jgi:hypothetical protein
MADYYGEVSRSANRDSIAIFDHDGERQKMVRAKNSKLLLRFTVLFFAFLCAGALVELTYHRSRAEGLLVQGMTAQEIDAASRKIGLHVETDPQNGAKYITDSVLGGEVGSEIDLEFNDRGELIGAFGKRFLLWFEWYYDVPIRIPDETSMTQPFRLRKAIFG